MNKIIKRLNMVLLFFIISLCGLTRLSIFAEENKTVKVGYFLMDGYHMVDEEGNMSGYGYDLLQQMSRYTNWQYDYVMINAWSDDIFGLFENDEIDILTSVSYNVNRDKLCDYSTLSIGSKSTILTCKAGNTKFIAGDYSTYEGITVGGLSGNTANDKFVEFALEKGFSLGNSNKVVLHESNEKLTNALQNGDIDAIVTSDLRTIKNEWILDKFSTSEMFIVVKEGNTSLLNEVNDVLSAMDTDNPEWRTTLWSKYYTPDSADKIAFSASENTYLNSLVAENKVFSVIVNPDREPYSYFENHVAKGILVDIFAEICERVGIKYTIYESTSLEDYRNKISSGEIDICLDNIFDYSSAEKLGYKLTDAYFSTSISKVKLKDDTDSDEVIAVSESSDILIYLPNLFNDLDIETFETVSSCVNSVLNRKSMYTYLYTYTAQKYIKNDYKNRLETILIPQYTLDFSIAISNNCNHLLITVLNKGVESISEEYEQEIVLNYTENIETEFNLIGYIYDYPFFFILILIFILFIIIFVIAMHLRMRNIRKDNLHQAELLRFLSYICKINEVVIDFNLITKIATMYYLNDNIIESHQVLFDNEYQEKFLQNIHSEDKDKFSNFFDYENNIEANDKDIYFEARLNNDSNEYVWYSYTIREVLKDELHPCNIIIFKQNIDFIKREEEASKQNLRDALDNAQRANEAKSAFMSRMSHEIRTPLNAIIGYMTIAKLAKNEQDKLVDCLQKSEIAAKHLLSIINDILDVSSIESGKMKISHESFNLKQLLTSVTSIFYTQSKEKNIDFQLHIHELTGEWIIGDQLRLNQIIMNLLSNAIKFTPSGGKVTLSVIEVSNENNNVHINFVVEDTGIGMSQEFLKRLFKPFEQENAEIALKYGGTGLGLSIVFNLINIMKGSIQVDSKQNEGSTFSVTLPFEYSDSNLKMQDIEYDFSSARVLVVDDTESDCNYIKELFKRCKIKCDVVFDGASALKQLRRRKNTIYEYNLCIIDWKMPVMDGIETSKRIRSEIGKEVPIIILTSYDTSEIADDAQKVGVNKIVNKPLFQSTIIDLLASTFLRVKLNEEVKVRKEDFNNVRVLLVEDNEMNRDIAIDLLKRAGIEVISAVNGKEGVDTFIQSPPNYYNIILMDIQMPIMNGCEATKEIRKSDHANAKSIPIIAMTADAFAEDVAKVLSCGMNAHIAKPIDYMKLLKTIRDHI